MCFQRNVHKPFPRHFRTIGDAGQNVRFHESGIILKNFRHRHLIRQQIQNERHPNAVSPYSRFATATLRVDPDAFQQFFARQAFHNSVNLAESRRFCHCKVKPLAIPPAF